MAKFVEGLRYSESHEWVRAEGEYAFIGISDFAQSELGDIVYVDFPAVGTSLSKGDVFGAVESTKSVSDLYSPVSGEVVEINAELDAAPEAINEDAYAAWIIKVKMTDASQVDSLLDAASYEAICK
ncbi:MAG: glycine cleavage system protein GcvH [Bacteroidales bacterium]|nr:glycine cleavage system protein GcvH [Candidatus Cryptobacteroides aphodequi]